MNRVPAIKAALFLLALAPLAWLAWRAGGGGLGANPLEAITHATGDWTLRFLLATLAVTPLRAFTGVNALIRFRRMLGLFAFFYGTLHLLTYLWFDQFFSWPEILRDIPKRPFITVGFAAFALMVPLAATSTAGMIRRLGGARWRALHRLVYASAVLGVVHYWWLVKADVRLPRAYAIVLGVLLAARLWLAFRRRARSIARTQEPLFQSRRFGATIGMGPVRSAPGRVGGARGGRTGIPQLAAEVGDDPRQEGQEDDHRHDDVDALLDARDRQAQAYPVNVIEVIHRIAPTTLKVAKRR